MADVTEGSANKVTIRRARREDVGAIARLFAADTAGGHGDTDDPAALADYLAAFDAIDDSPQQFLWVTTDASGLVVGTFETTLLRAMAGRGARSLLVGGVQVAERLRGHRIGEAMMRHAINEARRLGAAKVQLTSNLVRTDAHRFYERLGFRRSHAGFTLKVD